MGLLDDEYGSAAIASGIKGVLSGLEAGDNQKFRRMELDARIKAQEESSARQKALDEYSKQKDEAEQRQKEFSAGVDVRNKGFLLPEKIPGQSIYDTDPTALKVDPESTKRLAAQTALERAKNGYGGSESINLRKDAIDRREHERVLSRIASNPNIKARLTQYQNLDNALSTITQADTVTPQQVQEFQQAVRSNLGIKGGSGVGEREETYFKSLGLNAANFNQFLSGDPVALSKDTKLMHHLKNLASVEQGNIKKQYAQSLKAASGGHASMYARRPDLQSDLEENITGYEGLMSGGMPEQGMMTPQGAAPPKPKVTKQNGVTYTLNPQTGEYE